MAPRGRLSYQFLSGGEGAYALVASDVVIRERLLQNLPHRQRIWSLPALCEKPTAILCHICPRPVCLDAHATHPEQPLESNGHTGLSEACNRRSDCVFYSPM